MKVLTTDQLLHAERQRSTVLRYLVDGMVNTVSLYINDDAHEVLALMLSGVRAELKTIDAAHGKAQKATR